MIRSGADTVALHKLGRPHVRHGVIASIEGAGTIWELCYRSSLTSGPALALQLTFGSVPLAAERAADICMHGWQEYNR